MERTISRESPRARMVMAALDQPHIADIPVGGGENFVLGLQRRDFPAVFRGAQRGQHGDAPHAHGHHAVLGLLQGLQAGVFDVLTNDVACGVGVLGVRKDAPRMFNKHEVAGLAEVQLFEAGGKPGQGHVHAEYAGKVAVRVKHLVGDGKNHFAGIGAVAFRNAVHVRRGFAGHVPGPFGHVKAGGHLRIVNGGGVVAVQVPGVDFGIVRIALVQPRKLLQHAARCPGKVRVAEQGLDGDIFVGGEGIARTGHILVLGQKGSISFGRLQKTRHIDGHKAELALGCSLVRGFSLLPQRKSGVDHDARGQNYSGKKKTQNNA